MAEDRKKRNWANIASGVFAVVAFVGVSLGFEKVFALAQKPPRPTDEQIEQAFAGVEVYNVVRREFPEDYAALVAHLKAITRDGKLDPKQAAMEGARATQTIRMKYASYARRASHDTQARVLSAHADILDTVQRVKGDAVCTKYNNQGLAVLLPDLSFVQRGMEDAGVLVFTAIGEGRREAFDPDPVRPDDTVILTAALEARAKAASITLPDDMSQLDCPTTSLMLRTVANLPGEAGDRMRANLVQTLISAPNV